MSDKSQDRPDFKAIEKLIAKLARPAEAERADIYRVKDFRDRGYRAEWIRGLALRVCQKHSTWVIEYFHGGRKRQFKLCDSSWPLEQVWQEAIRQRGRVDTGIDIQAERGSARNTPLMRELIKTFKAERMPKLRPNTVSSYKTALNLYILPEFGSRKVSEFVGGRGLEVGQKWHDRIAATGGHSRVGHHEWIADGSPAPYAAARAAEVLKVLGDFAKEKDHVKVNPFVGIVTKPTRRRENPLTHEQLRRVVLELIQCMASPPEFVDHPRGGTQKRRSDSPGRGRDGWRRVRSARALFMILFMGRRKMEVLSATWPQFTALSAPKVWWNIPTEDAYGEKFIKRGGKVPVCLPVVEMLQVMRAEADVEDARRAKLGLPPQPYLFPAWRSTGQTPYQTNVNHAWWWVCDRVGIPKNSRVNADAVIVHDLRHTLGSIMANTSGRQVSIKAIMLHKRLATSDIYIHAYDDVARDDLDEAAAFMLGNRKVEPAQPIACARPTVAQISDLEKENAELRARLAKLEGETAAD